MDDTSPSATGNGEGVSNVTDAGTDSVYDLASRTAAVQTDGQDEQTEQIDLTVNGEERTFAVDPNKPLLYVLRNEAELNGPKFGCGFSQCGACKVLVDGEPVVSCTMAVSSVAGSEVTTASGLSTEGDLHPVQESFIEEKAAQCGYCIHGMMMEATALLEANADPSDEEIREALGDNLCRCGTHAEIRAAVDRAADETGGGQ